MARRAKVDRAAVAALARSPEVGGMVGRVSERVADNARDHAPTDPMGRSAREGIVTDVVMGEGGWEGRVGHVARAYGWHLARVEWGTRHARPQPHLRPAATEPVSGD